MDERLQEEKEPRTQYDPAQAHRDKWQARC
jgi:hypothetical protein